MLMTQVGAYQGFFNFILVKFLDVSQGFKRESSVLDSSAKQFTNTPWKASGGVAPPSTGITSRTETNEGRRCSSTAPIC